MISLSQLQYEKEVWERRNFPDMDCIRAVLGVVEEVGELSHAVLKRDQKIRGSEVEHSAAIQDACADIVIYLTSVARFEGFSLEEAVERVWKEVVQKRDWKANPESGRIVVTHWTEPPSQMSLL